MQSGFVIVNMQDRAKFETGRLHFGRHIASMVLLLHLTNFSKFQFMDKHVAIAFMKDFCHTEYTPRETCRAKPQNV